MGLRDLLRPIKNRFRPVYASPKDYWRNRYARFDSSLTGPGCVELDERENLADYEEKWRHIQAALARLGGCTGQSLLDAGCGVGAFTRRFVTLGWDVTAVDFVPEAIQIAKRAIGDRVTWYCAPLHEFAPGKQYDLVACIDVIFHITDDLQFKQTLQNLADLVKPAGGLLIEEHLVDESEIPAVYSAARSHVRWRSLDRYFDTLSPHWQLIHHDHYLLPMEKNTKDLLAFSRRDSD